ncbi:unnamed protein product [Urochloa humidicola]
MGLEEAAVAAVAVEVGVVAMGDQAMGPGQGTVREAAVEVLLAGMDMAVAAEAVRAVVLVALGMGLARALAMGLAVVVLVGMEVVEAAEVVVAKVAAVVAAKVGLAMAPAPDMGQVKGMDRVELMEEAMAAAVVVVALAMAPVLVLAMALVVDTTKLNFRTDYRVYSCKCVIISVVSLSHCLQKTGLFECVTLKACLTLYM